MTRDEALEQLRAMSGGGNGYRDQEIDHSRADDILLDLIDDAAIREAFEAIDKWYA